MRLDVPVRYAPALGARKWLTYQTVKGELSVVDEAKLDKIMQRARRVARGRPPVLRELGRRLDEEATTLEETAESEANTERARLIDESGSECDHEGGEEGGEDCGDAADDERAEEGGALRSIPTTPVVIMDMRTCGELLPKALEDSFGPVVELCQATPDACKPGDSTVKHAMDTRDNQISKIGRGGSELSVPPDQLLLATLPDGRGGVSAAMWAVVESVQRDRRHGAHLKISIVHVVVKPEYRRGDPELDRRNVKLDLLLAIVDAGLREPCARVAFTLADADCITVKRGAMWRRLFEAAVTWRYTVAFDTEGLDEAPKGKRGRVGALPCLWASPTGVSAARSDRKPRHPADKAVEQAAAELAALGEAATGDVDEVVPLT